MTMFLNIGVHAESQYKSFLFRGSNVHVIETNAHLLSVHFTLLKYRTLSKLIKENNAIGGINASFYNLNNRKPCGILIINGKLISKNIYSRPYMLINKKNDVIISNKDLNEEEINNIKYAIGGSTYLIKNNNIYVSHEHLSENFLNLKVKRVCLGIDKDGKILLVIISNASLYEAAKIMHHLQAIEAINLDGGASSQMYYKGKGYIIKSKRVPPVYILSRK